MRFAIAMHIIILSFTAVTSLGIFNQQDIANYKDVAQKQMEDQVEAFQNASPTPTPSSALPRCPDVVPPNATEGIMFQDFMSFHHEALQPMIVPCLPSYPRNATNATKDEDEKFHEALPEDEDEKFHEAQQDTILPCCPCWIPQQQHCVVGFQFKEATAIIMSIFLGLQAFIHCTFWKKGFYKDGGYTTAIVHLAATITMVIVTTYDGYVVKLI